MLKIHWIEILLRCTPEMFLTIWGVCVFARKSIDSKIYILCSIVMGIIVFCIRRLPIYFGAHTLISAILIICVLAIAGISAIDAIYGTLLMLVLLSLSEVLNIEIINLINVNTSINVLSPIKKSILGIPSLIITALFIIIIRYLTRKMGKKSEQLKDYS